RVGAVIGRDDVRQAVAVDVAGHDRARQRARAGGLVRGELERGVAVAAADREIAAGAVGRGEIEVPVAVDVAHGQGRRALVDADGGARPGAAAEVRTAAHGAVQAETVD